MSPGKSLGMGFGMGLGMGTATPAKRPQNGALP